MKVVIIAGAGEVGRGVAQALIYERKNVILIDSDPDALKSAQSLVCLLIAGDVMSRETLNQAGIQNPFNEIDCAEIYVPFSWYEPMWLENLGFCDLGEGWKLTDKDATAIDGELPFNMSGGVLSSNPIGASGMIRFGEAALQVMGLAEDHQVEDA